MKDSVLRKLNEEDVLRMTNDQKESVLSCGKIIVSASAGSGKTTTMVLKILTLIAEGYDMDSMMIVVYNDAAAAELKLKLHDKLCERIDDPSLDNDTRDRFVRAVMSMDLCNISTIHAFCRNYAKTNFETLGISPQFEILDAQKEAKLMDMALNRVFSEYDEEDECFSDILEIFSRQRQDENLKSNILSLYRVINIQPDGGNAFRNKVSECYDVPFEGSFFYFYIHKCYLDMFGRYYSALKDACKDIYLSGQEKYKPYAAFWENKVETVFATSDFKELLKWAECDESYPGTTPKYSAKSETPADDKVAVDIFKDIKNLINEEIKELQGYASKYDIFVKAHEQNGRYIHKLLEIVERFSQVYSELKNAENKYTFDDLLHFAIRVINSKGENKDKFEYVFVDEYQDVTPLTAFITSSFMNENSYIVGDVKQSIYGFNLADPQLFLDAQKEYSESGGHAIDFNRNFRSKSSILNFVNAVFDVIMTKENSGIDYAATARFEVDELTEKGGIVDVTLITNKVPKTEPDYGSIYEIENDVVEADDNRQAFYVEGQYISDKIKQLISGDEYISDGKGGLRKITYSDIAILFRSRYKNSETVLQAVRDSGIPLDESSFTNLNDNPERELMNMLRIIDNPKQDIYFGGFLLSFFGGYTDEEVLKIANNFRGVTLYDKFLAASSDSDEISSKVKETLDVLAEYRVKASFKNVSDLMSGIIADYSYDAYLARNGQNNIDELKQFILSKSDRKGSTLSEFINDYSANENVTSISDTSDSVKVSTFHGYKGLETPIVFVANIASGFNKQDLTKDLLFNGSGYAGLKYFDMESKIRYNSASNFCMANILNDRIIREEKRLLYVALTRAKERMYICGTSDDKSKENPNISLPSSNLDLLRIAAYANPGKIRINYIEYLPSEEESEETEITGTEEDFSEEIKEYQKFEYPYAVSTKLGMKFGVSSLISDTDGTQYLYESKADIGTCYHKVMQYIDYTISTVDGVKDAFEEFINEGVMTKEETDLVNPELILMCLKQDFIKKAHLAELKLRRHREEKFMMYVPANTVSDKEEFNTDDKILVQGIVDLFVEGDDEKILVDFKYSNLSDDLLVGRYTRQLKLYKMALEGKLGQKIDKIMLYSFKTGNVMIIE